jgi:hypothetical protein
MTTNERHPFNIGSDEYAPASAVQVEPIVGACLLILFFLLLAIFCP